MTWFGMSCFSRGTGSLSLVLHFAGTIPCFVHLFDAVVHYLSRIFLNLLEPVLANVSVAVLLVQGEGRIIAGLVNLLHCRGHGGP